MQSGGEFAPESLRSLTQIFGRSGCEAMLGYGLPKHLKGSQTTWKDSNTHCTYMLRSWYIVYAFMNKTKTQQVQNIHQLFRISRPALRKEQIEAEKKLSIQKV